jgi:hypothetical protein
MPPSNRVGPESQRAAGDNEGEQRRACGDEEAGQHGQHHKRQQPQLRLGRSGHGHVVRDLRRLVVVELKYPFVGHRRVSLGIRCFAGLWGKDTDWVPQRNRALLGDS